MPLQVAIVTLVLGQYLKTREKRERLGKINMAIGAFFSEAGNPLLVQLLKFTPGLDDIRTHLNKAESWTSAERRRAQKSIQTVITALSCAPDDLTALKSFLSGKRNFLLGMLANPNLLEHESFTDMLWAVFHLTDELTAREDLACLPEPDLRHLEDDVKRALGALLIQWLEYMAHLNAEYPYLFSLEVRRSPFNPAAGVTIRETCTQKTETEGKAK